MKILLQNRPRDLWVGGDQIQLEKTMEALEKLGHEVEYSGESIYPSAIRYRIFDIIHTFNFSMKWTQIHIGLARMHKKKIVCSMIYHEGEQFVDYKKQQMMVDAAHALIFLSPQELERAERHLTIPKEKVHFIPNGIDPFWFKPVEVRHAERYVLTVGRIEESKGQKEVAKACKSIGIPYVCVGEVIDEDYAKMCQAFGAVLVPKSPPEELIKWYAGCSAYVLASKAEIFPLSVMEAGAQGAQILLTDKSSWKDIPNVLMVEHGNWKQIKGQLTIALLRPKNLAFKEQLKKMTWENVAKKCEEIYLSL